MIKISPAMRISISLAFLTAGIVMTATFFGIAPDNNAITIEARKQISETLAVNLSLAANRSDFQMMKESLQAFVDRNESVISSALRSKNGRLVAHYGDHDLYWVIQSDGKSTPTNVQVPLFSGDSQWGTLEIAYKSLWSGGFAGFMQNSIYGLALFVFFSGLAGYYIIMRRTLKELDPGAVIPARVRTAFDSLTEGILILDEQERVVLTNSVLAKKFGCDADALMGIKASELGWTGDRRLEAPWSAVMRTGEALSECPLELRNPVGSLINFSVNGTPILDGNGKPRGALMTFNDVTLLKRKNEQLFEKNQKLNLVVSKLSEREQEIKKQNKELEFHASRDALTGILNRRALFEQGQTALKDARFCGDDLACIMLDIDHFKSINDTYGHNKGDEVIAFLGALFASMSRSNDIVGRYGGEEFCIFLPGLKSDAALAVAERLRDAVDKRSLNDVTGVGINITSSFGVAILSADEENITEFVAKADHALYLAKRKGRNRVEFWDAGQHTSGKRGGNLSDNRSQVDNASSSQDKQAIVGEAARLLELDMPVANTGLASSQNAVDPNPEPPAYDDLTGLPNRILFHDRVQQAINQSFRGQNQFAVVSFAIDKYKAVGQAYGSDVAEELVKMVAGRLSKILRSTDTVVVLGSSGPSITLSRFVNDEFGLLITDLESTDVVIWAIQRIIDSLASSFTIGEHDIYSSANIGISIYPQDGTEPDSLIQKADAARDQADKESGANRFVFYSEDIHKTSIDALETEGELKLALEREEFELHYQPRVDMGTGNIVGLEALIRWRHPERGLISPDDFIPIVEHSGLMNEITNWVVVTAARQARVWVEAGHEKLVVGVNLSPSIFRHGDIVRTIINALEDANLNARNFEVEVTESSIIQSVDVATAALAKLREMGVSVAIDDFGTGYSSLSYLRNMPADIIKIDRAFILEVVTDEKSRKLYSAIIAMTHELDLKTVAEGAETQEQVDFLRRHACDQVQGYFFSKPLPVRELTLLLDSVGKQQNYWHLPKAPRKRA